MQKHLVAMAFVAALGIATPALAAPAAAEAHTIGGVSFEPHLQLGGQSLLLNGIGVRQVAWIQGYAAALYMAQRASTADAAVAVPGPKRVQMRMLLDVPTTELTKAVRLGVERNQPPAMQQQLAERVQRFGSLVATVPKVKKGDTINLDFLPAQGMVLTLNGRALGPAIPGEDFYGALLKVFVGERVSDNKLRAGLLGVAG